MKIQDFKVNHIYEEELFRYGVTAQQERCIRWYMILSVKREAKNDARGAYIGYTICSLLLKETFYPDIRPDERIMVNYFIEDYDLKNVREVKLND